MIHTSTSLTKLAVRIGATGILSAAFAAVGAGAAEMRAPKGPIEITVGTSPGGTPDVLMRRAAKILNEEKIIENPIAVVNRVGGSWMVATNYVINRPADENLVFVITTPQFTVPLIQGLPSVHDKLTPVAVYIQNDIVLLTQPSSPWKGFKDFVDAAKQRERSVKFAGAQMGSTDSIIAGAIEKATGTKLNYIPFDGGGAAHGGVPRRQRRPRGSDARRGHAAGEERQGQDPRPSRREPPHRAGAEGHPDRHGAGLQSPLRAGVRHQRPAQHGPGHRRLVGRQAA